MRHGEYSGKDDTEKNETEGKREKEQGDGEKWMSRDYTGG